LRRREGTQTAQLWGPPDLGEVENRGKSSKGSSGKVGDMGGKNWGKKRMTCEKYGGNSSLSKKKTNGEGKD